MSEAIRRLARKTVPSMGLCLMSRSEFYCAHADAQSLPTY
jgi:hypothetical protein